MQHFIKKTTDQPLIGQSIGLLASHVPLGEGGPSVKINCHLFVVFSFAIGAIYLVLLLMFCATF